MKKRMGCSLYCITERALFSYMKAAYTSALSAPDTGRKEIFNPNIKNPTMAGAGLARRGGSRGVTACSGL